MHLERTLDWRVLCVTSFAGTKIKESKGDVLQNELENLEHDLRH